MAAWNSPGSQSLLASCSQHSQSGVEIAEIYLSVLLQPALVVFFFRPRFVVKYSVRTCALTLPRLRPG